MRISYLLTALLLSMSGTPAHAQSGDWPRPRRDARLTAFQPLPGAMRMAPGLVARYDLGRWRPPFTTATAAAGDVALCVVGGALHCYDGQGALQWRSHPPGLNFERIVAVADLDGDGMREIVLQAGRPTQPFGAATIVRLDTGELLWSYEVEPMSYAWYLYVDSFLPGETGQQVLVLMHGYPPDEKNGYIALFDFPRPGALPRQRWRYDFHEYTCFPSLLRSDLDGDGAEEICVQTHSRMWVLDPGSGLVKQFLGWEVTPANVRSYGLVRFVDLDQDGREDFLCIATFAQHHEVLLNREGRLQLAWAHGWPESVTTGKVATTWPEPPHADVNGDGRLEIALSMFNSEDEQAWLVRVYDALSGQLLLRYPGAFATAVADVDGDGQSEILVALSADPTRALIRGAAVLRAMGDRLVPIWEKEGAEPLAEAPFAFKLGSEVRDLVWEGGALREKPRTPAPPSAGADLAHLPPVQGAPAAPLLVVDTDGDGRNEIALYRDGQALILGLGEGGAFVEKGRYPSSGLPVFADLDGDGYVEIVTGQVAPDAPPRIEARTPALADRLLWARELPPATRSGLPYGHRLYLQAGHFTGGETPDLYVWAGLPLVRSVVLEGRSGALRWERGEIAEIERFWGPSVNLASSLDADGDGAEDLVFTNPDYYCILSGPSGKTLHGPSFPPRIFSQPSQGLYSFPALLEREDGPPLVCLAGAHYFVAAMSLDARPLWHRLPAPGENRAANEGFLKTADGRWLMGFGRQNGDFACVDVESGHLRWEVPVHATCSDVVSGDLDGDGRAEFLFGTSHGQLWAVGDTEGQPRILWKVDLPGASGPPIIADVDGDGSSEILVCTLDGYLNVLKP